MKFGKTLVTSQDIVEYNYFLNLNIDLKTKKTPEIDEIEMQKEEERVEQSLKLKLRKTLIEVIKKEIALRGLVFNENDVIIVQNDGNTAEKAETSNPMARLFSFLKSIPNPAKSRDDELAENQIKQVNELFERLYKSNKWDNDYEEISQVN